MNITRKCKKFLQIAVPSLTIIASLFMTNYNASALQSSIYLGRGTYYIQNVNGKYLTVNDSNTNNVSVTSGRNNKRHKVRLWYDEGSKLYRIQSETTRKSLDVSGGSRNNGANIQMWNDNSTCAQQWAIGEYRKGVYLITNACSGKALDIAGGSNANGANVQLYQYNGTPAQQWKLISDESRGLEDYNQSTIETGVNSTTLDVSGGSRVAGANIQLWNSNGTGAQKFRFYRHEDGSYRIKNIQANKSLDVAGGSRNSGANVQLWHDNDTCAQRWFINSITEYDIINACTGYPLSIKDGKPWLIGANIIVSNRNIDRSTWQIR